MRFGAIKLRSLDPLARLTTTRHPPPAGPRCNRRRPGRAILNLRQRYPPREQGFFRQTPSTSHIIDASRSLLPSVTLDTGIDKIDVRAARFTAGDAAPLDGTQARHEELPGSAGDPPILTTTASYLAALITELNRM